MNQRLDPSHRNRVASLHISWFIIDRRCFRQRAMPPPLPRAGSPPPLSTSKIRTASAGMATGICEPTGACTSGVPTAITKQPRTWKPTWHWSPVSLGRCLCLRFAGRARIRPRVRTERRRTVHVAIRICGPSRAVFVTLTRTTRLSGNDGGRHWAQSAGSGAASGSGGGADLCLRKKSKGLGRIDAPTGGSSVDDDRRVWQVRLGELRRLAAGRGKIGRIVVVGRTDGSHAFGVDAHVA